MKAFRNSLRAQWRQLTFWKTSLFLCSTPHSPLHSRFQINRPCPLCRSLAAHLVEPRSHCRGHAPRGDSRRYTPAHPCGPAWLKGPPPVCLRHRKVPLYPCLSVASCSHRHVCRNCHSTWGSSSSVRVPHCSSSHLAWASYHNIFEGVPIHALAGSSLQGRPF